MQELTVNHNFIINHNMPIVKNSIVESIAKYDVVITDDTLPDAKRMMSSINKEKKAFTDKCKEFISIIRKPISEFEAARKDIELLYDGSRNRLKQQVDMYEAVKSEKIKNILVDYKNLECEKRAIDNNAIIIDDLVMLTAITAKNTPASKIQEIIEQRIVAVENEILKARLEAQEKLKREHEIAERARIQAEEKAAAREQLIIANAKRAEEEAKRQSIKREMELTENAIRAKEKARLIAIEKERVIIANAEKAKEEAVRKAVEASNIKQQEPKPEHKKTITDDGKRIFTVTTTFQIKAPANTQVVAVRNKIEELMRSVGINNINQTKVY